MFYEILHAVLSELEVFAYEVPLLEVGNLRIFLGSVGFVEDVVKGYP